MNIYITYEKNGNVDSPLYNSEWGFHTTGIGIIELETKKNKTI